MLHKKPIILNAKKTIAQKQTGVFNNPNSYCNLQDRYILSRIQKGKEKANNFQITPQEQRTLGLYFNAIPAYDKNYKSSIFYLKSGPVLVLSPKKKNSDAPNRIYPLVAKEDFGTDQKILDCQYRYADLKESERVAQLDKFTRLGRQKLGEEINEVDSAKLPFQFPTVKNRPLKILFLSLYPDTRKDIFQSTGPNYIESYLKNNMPEGSIDTLHIETSLDDDETIKKKIEDFKPDIIGLSTKTNSHGQFKKWMTYLDEKMPDTLRVIGGQLANSSYPEILEDYPNVITMFDNGEVPTLLLAKGILDKNISSIGKIPNLAFNYNGKTRLTNFKDYNYIVSEHSIPSDSNIGEVIKKNGIVALRMSQGCWGNCTFCTHPGKWHGSNIDNVVKVLGEWKNKYGLSSIFFTDDEVVDKDPKRAYNRLNEISEKLIKADLGITWTTDLRADCISWLDDALLEKMKKAGCVSIFLGIESGSDTQLRRYGKLVNGVKVGVDVNKKAIEYFSKHNIKVGIGWIPFDPLMPTLRELKENINFIEENDLLNQNIRLDTSLRLQRGAQYTKTVGKYNMGLLGPLQPNMFHYDGKYLDPRVGTIRDHMHKWINDMQDFDDEINSIKFKLARDPSQTSHFAKKLKIGQEVQKLTLEYFKALINIFPQNEEDKVLDGIASENEDERLEAQRKIKDTQYMSTRRMGLIKEVNLKKAMLFEITQQFEKEREKLLEEFFEL